MGWFSEDSDQAKAYAEYQNTPNEAKVSHELISGAAAFAAMKSYEKHCEDNGTPEDHAGAKEIVAGLAGVFIDHEIETRGRDCFDEERARYEATRQAHSTISEDNY